MSPRWSRRGLACRQGDAARAPVQRTPPVVANRSRANGSSPRLNQVQPTLVPEAASLSSPSSTVPELNVAPIPAVQQVQDDVNCIGRLRDQTQLRYFMDKFVEASCQSSMYEAELLAMEHKKSYTIKLSLEHMWEFYEQTQQPFVVDLIIDICDCIKQDRLEDWLLPAARDFLRSKKFGNEEAIRTETRFSFSGFPESIQKFREFTKKYILVEYIHVDQIPVLATTSHGSIVMQMLMVAMSEYHSDNISWDGGFSIDNILIIKRSERHGDTQYETYKMKIVQKPVELIGRKSLRKAMVRDLHKARKILIENYRKDPHSPVYFLDFEEKLETSKKFVQKKWFMKCLIYHPAIMTSADRITFLTKLRRTLVDDGNQMTDGYDWKEIIESEFESEGANKAIIAVLQKVYRYDTYTDTVRDLIRFMRNVLEHGKHNTCELESYLAEIFSSFLPDIVQNLLKLPTMQTRFKDAWSTYEVSKLIVLT